MVPLFFDPSYPQLEDPSLPLDQSHWQPQDKRTSKLTRCLEALRDLTTALRSVAEDTVPNISKRLLKQSIPPLYNLATALRDLNNEIISNCPKELTEEARAAIAHHFNIFATAVPTIGDSPLKTARDKIAAHLDKDTQTPGYRDFWERFDLHAVADWTMSCIRMFVIFIQPDLYHWKRNDAQPGCYSIMRFDGNQIVFGVTGDKKPEMLSITLTRSPKDAIERELRVLLALVKKLYPEAGKTDAYKELE